MNYHTAKRRESTAAMNAVRPVLAERCKGVCELCTLPLAIDDAGDFIFEAHHRKLRRHGGGDGPENLLVVHSLCHHQVIHGQPRVARNAGWIVSSFEDAAEKHVLLLGVRRCRLTVDGQVEDLGAWV